VLPYYGETKIICATKCESVGRRPSLPHTAATDQHSVRIRKTAESIYWLDTKIPK